MTPRLLPEAEAEAQEAARWYEKRQPGLGDAFLKALADGLESVESHPERYLRVPDAGPDRTVRRFLLDRFPYKIIYAIHGDETVVLAVSHVRQHPTYWKNRGEE